MGNSRYTKIKASVIVPIVFSLITIITGCTEGPRLDLSREWRMKKTDDNSRKYAALDYNDTSWNSINLPRILSPERARSIFWLRKTFTVPVDYKDKDLALNLGKIWEADEIYINGIRMGSHGGWFPEYFGLWNFHRSIPLPENILRFGEQNVIALRVLTNHISMFDGRPFISDSETVRIHTFFKRFWAEYIVIALTVLAIFLGIMSLVQYLLYRKYKVPLLYGVCVFMLALMSVQYYLPDLSIISFSIKDNIYYAILVVVTIGVYFLLELILEIRIKVVEYISIILGTACILLALTATVDDPVQKWRVNIIFSLSILAEVMWAGVIVKSLMHRRTMKEVVLGLGFMIFITSTFHDMLMMMQIIIPETFISPIGFHIMLICIGIALSFRTSEILRSDELKRYLPAQLVESILKGTQRVEYENERRKLTIFFSDLKGFTETTDSLEAEELTAMLNEYLTEMTAIADRYSGTIDKFVGDAVMIFFGAPDRTDDRDQALRCVRMAIDMQRRMKELQSKWFDEGIEYPLSMRVGINTGVAAVGNFGAENRLSYTAIGGQVNLAARLEAQCEPGDILISHSTYSLVKEEIPCEERGKITVKGIHREVLTYRVAEI